MKTIARKTAKKTAVRRDSSEGVPRISHLRLANWRNFREVDVGLPGRTFIVGPNASGKSNLLDVFRFLHDVSSTVGGGFQEAVSKRGGVSALRSLFARTNPQIEISVTLQTDSGDTWRYELHFNHEKTRPRPFITHEAIWRGDKLQHQRPDADDKKDPERLIQTHLEQVSANKDFRALAEFLNSIQYRHIVPQLVREPDRWSGKDQDPFGGDFLEQIAVSAKHELEKRLKRMEKALKQVVPQLGDLKVKRDARGRPHLQVLFAHWRPNAGRQNEMQLSDGTLRLLGLLWSLQDAGGPLLLEEPELSLHADVVRVIPQLFAVIQQKRRRQIIVSTHAADLFGDEGISLEEVLILKPEKDGTIVRSADKLDSIRMAFEAGVSLKEIIQGENQVKSAYKVARFAGE